MTAAVGFTPHLLSVTVQPRCARAKRSFESNEAAKWGFIDPEGKLAIELKFDDAGSFHLTEYGDMADKVELRGLQQTGALALIRSEAHSGLVTRGRRAAAALQLSRNEPFCLAAVMQNGAWGIIDRTGQFAIPPACAWVGCFSGGRACCSKSANGDARPVLISWRFDHGMTAADGERFLFRYGQQPGVLPTNSLGYMDTAGEIIVPPRFVCAEPFRDGVAKVAMKKEGGTGFIDCEGRVIGSLEFDGAANFQEGYAVVTVGDRFGAITLQGQYAVPPKFDYVWDFSEGLARVLVGEKVGFVNTRGELVIDPIFDAADGFSEGLAAVCVEQVRGTLTKPEPL